MSEKTDFAIMVSSDLIAEVMGEYFNSPKFREKRLKIIDLKGQEDGYVFSLAFDAEVSKNGLLDPHMRGIDHVYKSDNTDTECNEAVNRHRIEGNIAAAMGIQLAPNNCKPMEFTRGYVGPVSQDRDNKGKFTKKG